MLQRIEEYGPKINAIVTVMKESAIERAKAADEATRRKESWGLLHGVPCTVKDTLEIAGVRTTAGAPFLAQYVPKQDAAVVERLKKAGAIIIGKTNTPLMAGDGQTFNEIFGTTNNPYDVKRTPGGSSGGSAAALAAGMTYLCIGSDLAWSIRAPAHFCGVYGHKPSLGVIPQRGHIPPLPDAPPQPPTDLAVIGPLARSAADLKGALVALGGPDQAEAVAYRWTLPPARRKNLADYEIGFVLDDPLCPVVPEVNEILLAAIDALAKAGANIKEGWPQGVIPGQQYDTWQYLFNSFSDAPQMRDDQESELRQRASNQDGSYEAKKALALTAPHKRFLVVSGSRMAARAALQEYFRKHDAFLLPTIFAAAPPHDHTPFDHRELPTLQGARPYTDLYFWISFATLAGLPATVAPVGQTKDGLPIGIQIVGPYLEDATPIDLAQRLSDIVGGFVPPYGF
jgi:amidase